jgi:hypothetical protein
LKSDADDLLRNGFGLAHERTDKARGYDQTQRDAGEFYSVTLSIWRVDNVSAVPNQFSLLN